MARLLAIAVRPPGIETMQLLVSAKMTPESGLHGDKRSRSGRRQVTVMTQSDWQRACEEVGVELAWTTRRANLLIDELILYESTGALIQIGSILLEVTGESDPCAKMEASCSGLFRALKPYWRGGVTCKVIKGGNFRCGDSVILKPKI
ncbi:MAG: hypothetical protein OEX12_03490 [Gammaproteobacteria bacterium]|nr:hypothetical protein [Gammaproteobacteria bacterium]